MTMIKRYLIIFLLAGSSVSVAQKVAINPTIEPSLFQYNSQITVTYDVTGTTLATLSNAWLWVWIPGKNLNGKYNINPATAAADLAKFTKSTAGGSTKFTITFKASDFFASDISSETQLGMLLKANDWPNGQTTDFISDFGFKINLITPSVFPVAVQGGSVLTINASVPTPAKGSAIRNEPSNQY
jgi:hypothetical protein